MTILTAIGTMLLVPFFTAIALPGLALGILPLQP